MKNKGFTLIELIIVMGIISVLATMGLSLYSGLNQNRLLRTQGQIFTQYLNQAKSFSQSQVVECSGTFSGYQVVTNSVASTAKVNCYELDAVCTNPSAVSMISSKCLTPPVQFDTSTQTTISFPRQGSYTQTSVTLKNGSSTLSASLSTQGVITIQ